MNKLEEFVNDLNNVNVWAENFINKWKNDNLLEQGFKQEDIVKQGQIICDKFEKILSDSANCWFNFEELLDNDDS